MTAYIIYTLICLGAFFIGRMSKRSVDKPITTAKRINKDNWHIHADTNYFAVQKQKYRRNVLNDGLVSDGYTSHAKFFFEPTDVQSRADALTEAEILLDGLLDAQRQAKESNLVRM